MISQLRLRLVWYCIETKLVIRVIFLPELLTILLQSLNQSWSSKTQWRVPVLRRSNHVKLFPTKSRINEMAARERQLESERLEAMEAVRSEMSNGTKNTRKKKKLVEVEQPQKEKEIRKPPLPPLKVCRTYLRGRR